MAKTKNPALEKTLEVAEYILSKEGPMRATKLHKLLYYSQAWHLAWEGDVLFETPIMAWASGPVVAELHELHEGSFWVYPEDLYAAYHQGKKVLDLDDRCNIYAPGRYGPGNWPVKGAWGATP